MASPGQPEPLFRFRFRAVPALALALFATACGDLDIEQARLCRLLVPALEAPDSEIRILDEETESAAGHAVRLRYRVARSGAPDEDHWVSCHFAGGRLDPERLALMSVATDRDGVLSESRLYLLRRFWLGSFEAQAETEAAAAGPAGSLETRLLYLLQLFVNALTASCVYGLLAVGYTMIFGLIERINLAFGELAMLGAFATVIGVPLVAPLAAAWLAPALLTVLLFAMATAAVYGWTLERVVFRPLRGASSQAILIATLGLAIGLQEYVRLTQGAGERWLQRPFTGIHALAEGEAFEVVLSTAQILVVAVTAALYAALHLLLRRTAFGRAQRACADDAGLAALSGVDVTRTVSLSFALAGACAGAAGLILALYYGGTHFFMGHLIGFKALVAAVIGGIGSVPGAMLGGVLIALLEIFWSGYLAVAYKDIAVFGVLALFLVFRPQGLFGHPRYALD